MKPKRKNERTQILKDRRKRKGRKTKKEYYSKKGIMKEKG